MTVWVECDKCGTVHRIPIPVFDVRDALDKLKSLLGDYPPHKIVAVATTFPFDEGWDLVVGDGE